MDSSSETFLSVECCVVGGGPAGMMLGFLLARAGVSVAVLEKHADFLLDFRGDTIHPSTLRIMDELGLLDALLALPHQKAEQLRGQAEQTGVRDPDGFSRQWHILMKGSIVAAAEGDAEAARRTKEVAALLLAHELAERPTPKRVTRSRRRPIARAS